jgi:hypothetical protein
MAFPFSVKYSNKLEGDISEEDYSAIFSIISNILINKPAKDIVLNGDQLQYRPGNYVGRGNIMEPIDKGVFTLVKQGDRSIITYEFFMYKMLAITFAMGIFFGLFSKLVWVGVASFLWLGGMNWLIGIMRHSGMFDEITSAINDFIAQKNPQPTIQ